MLVAEQIEENQRTQTVTTQRNLALKLGVSLLEQVIHAVYFATDSVDYRLTVARAGVKQNIKESVVREVSEPGNAF